MRPIQRPHSERGSNHGGYSRATSVLMLWIPCLVLAPMSPGARAESLIGHFKRVVPTVETAHKKRGFVPVLTGSALYWDTLLRTGLRGAADVQLSNGTQMAMRAHSLVNIARPASRSEPLVLQVLGAFSRVFVHPRGNTVVRTKAATAAARGTQFVVQQLDENTTQVIVTEGSVDFGNNFDHVEVLAGQTSTARVGSAPTPPRTFNNTGDLDWTAGLLGLPLELPVLPSDSRPLRDALALTDEVAQREALQVLEAAHDAQGARAAVALGLLELRAGNLDASQNYLRDASARDAFASTPHALLSFVVLSRSQNQSQVASAVEEARAGVRLAEQAAHDARRAAFSSPSERSLAHAALAHALFFAGKNEEALPESRRAVSLAGGESDPLSPLALLVQGRTYLARNQPDQALEAFAQAAALAPNLFLARREVGASYATSGQLERAEKDLRRAIELRPDDTRSHALLGDVLARRGYPQESRREFDLALQQEPGNALTRTLLAGSLIRGGHLEEARQQLELARSDDPEAGLTMVLLSEEALYAQNLSAALDLAQQGVSRLPKSSRAHYQLGRVLLEQGLVMSAESQFRQAVDLDQNFAEARYALGVGRERTERGLLLSLDSVNGAGQRTVGGVGSPQTLQNLQTPGADDRLQALTSNPIVVQLATRASGDTQLEGAFGSRQTEQGFSLLRPTDRDQGIIAFNAERQDNDGVRLNADRTFNRGSLLLGRRSNASTSGGFVLGEFEHARYGSNTLFESDPFSEGVRNSYNLPRVLMGYNFQNRASVRTSVLVQGQKFNRSSFDTTDANFISRIDDHSLNIELRHDRGIGGRNQLNAGFATGWRRRAADSTVSAFTVSATPVITNTDSRIRQTQLWLRDTFALSPRFSLAGELRILNLDYSSSRTRSKSFDLPQAHFTTGVPLVVAAYQLDSRSAVRLRARRPVASVRDFELLFPNDPFSLASEDLPGTNVLGVGAHGRSLELEYDHSFKNSSLMRLTLLQQDLRNADAVGVDGNLPRVRNSVLRATYETPLRHNLSFFSSLDMIDASNQTQRERIALLPHFTIVGGLQYHDSHGYFGDLLGAYVSGSTFPPLDSTRSAQRGGFGVIWARAGRRLGLKSSVYIEARNLLGKDYSRFDTMQPGRQIRIGVVSRFGAHRRKPTE